MKARKSRDLIIFLILIPVFLWAAFYISSRMENRLPDYAVINKSPMGSSVLYESLRQLKLPVERSLKPVAEQNTDTVQIIVPGGSFDVNSDALKDWLNKGGILVHLAAENLRFIEYGTQPDIKGRLMIYKYGRGMIIGGNAFAVTNKELMKNTDAAYELLEEIIRQGNREIYFNETHLFTAVQNKTLWDYVPLWIRFIIFQFILALAAFFYFKGKRFGKPITLHEEIERSENEYLYSASSLYRQAKTYDLMARNYYSNLLRELKANHEDWVEQWERENLPELGKAKQVYEFMMNIKDKKKSKEYMQIISYIERLTNILRKRRDSYWKTLRK
jgi:hypothetical protein